MVMARLRGATSAHNLNGAPAAPLQAGSSFTSDQLPPPSTIAAQIVNNHTQATFAQREQPEKKVLFGQLLQEFLRDPTAVEPDLETNAQLISVVVEAGLDPILQTERERERETGFIKRIKAGPAAAGLGLGLVGAEDILLTQAADSIKVIRLTVLRNPELLLLDAKREGKSLVVGNTSASTSEDQLAAVEGSSGKPKLLVWLLAKLVPFWGRQSLESLDTRVTELWAGCIGMLVARRELWLHGVALVKLFLACVEDIVKSFDHILPPSQSSQASAFSSFSTALPPLDAVALFWPDSKQLVALPTGSQVIVKSPAQAFVIAFQLLIVIDGLFVGNGLANSIVLEARARATNAAAQLWQAFRHLKGRLEGGSTWYRDKIMELALQHANGIYFCKDGQSLVSSTVKANVFLVEILSDVISTCASSTAATPPSIRLQEELALCLTQLRASVESGGHGMAQLVTVRVVPQIQALARSGEIYSGLDQDLQIALSLFVPTRSTSQQQHHDQQGWPDSLLSVQKSFFTTKEIEFSNPQLNLYISQLKARYDMESVTETDTNEPERPAKRRRTGDLELEDMRAPLHVEYKRIFDSICQVMPRFELLGLEIDNIKSDYVRLSEPERYQLLSTSGFAMLYCAVSNCLPPLDTTSNQSRQLSCRICDTSSREQKRQDNSYWYNVSLPDGVADRMHNALGIIEGITEIPEFQKSRKARVLLAIAVRRLLNHTNSEQSFDLEGSKLGQWCLKSLHSSIRELRIAAGKAIAVFLRDDIPDQIKSKNRHTALEYCRVLASRDNLGEQETLIMALGELSRVCGDDELNIVLFQLISHLGNSNSVICGIAFNELLHLSESYNVSPGELLRPFWRNLAITVVRDLPSRPQKIQNLAEMLGYSVNQLLLLTQTESLPYLVLMKRKEVIQRIATARGPAVTVEELCTMPPRNLAAILALLLRQPSQDMEKTAMELLCDAAPAFRESDLSSLVRIEPILTACELLKAAADQTGDKKVQIHETFYQMAALLERKTSVSKSATRRQKLLQAFFEENILGIMAHFSHVIGNQQSYPLSERRRCLAAIEELATLAGAQVTIALPQIRACLHSALEEKALCDQIFSVWAALLKTVVQEEDLESIIDQTFSIIAQHWDWFSPSTHKKAHDAVAGLIQTKRELLTDRIQSLPSLPDTSLLSKFHSEIQRLKDNVKVETRFEAFAKRCQDENAVVVAQALRELIPFVETHQQVLHEGALSPKYNSVVSALLRSIMDASARFAEDHKEIVTLAAECLGIIGCLDPYKVETVREKREILVLSNFDRANEVIDFTTFLLEEVLIKAFHSATNAMAQGFLAYVMQELLKFCGFNEIAVVRPRASQPTLSYTRWMEISESVRSSLTPFLTSKYMIKSSITVAPTKEVYPIFSSSLSHGIWLRNFVFDLLQRGKGENAQMIFPVLARVIHGHDLSIANFMLPFACRNVIVGGTDKETHDVGVELLAVLEHQVEDGDHMAAENVKQCSENVFQVLDFLSKWLQEKRKAIARAGKNTTEMDQLKDVAQMSSVERVLAYIPAQVISRRAVECGSFARALYHWEQYIRQEREKATRTKSIFDQDSLYQHLQSIYAQIDEPDHIEGISAHLHVLDPEQQVLEHRKAGRWTAAQSWYELALVEKPDDQEVQVHLLTCLKESGQYDSVLNCVESIRQNSPNPPTKLLPFAAEAAWVTGKWQKLEQLLAGDSGDSPAVVQQPQEFSVGIGKAFVALKKSDALAFAHNITSLRDTIARGLLPSTTASLQACHEHMLKLHVLYEVEAISGVSHRFKMEMPQLLETLDRRLNVLGSYTSDKQYVLGIRRACMQLSSLEFDKTNIASVWLTSARLARKANFTATAYNAVLHAARLGDDASKIEHSRLLWRDVQHRKAIQTLEGAIAINAFDASSFVEAAGGTVSMTRDADKDLAQNRLAAKAHLLLARWLDAAGQTKSELLIQKYNTAVITHARSDKGHYYLGKHYNKILESEKALPPNKQSRSYLAGELIKLVIENFTRSLAYGAKYYYHTVPKVITLWQDFGTEVHSASPKTHVEHDLHNHKIATLDHINKYLRRHIEERTPIYTWYTAFSQIITRIGQPNPKVYDILAHLIVKITAKYPQQALWSLLAVARSTTSERQRRGQALLAKVKDLIKKNERTHANFKNLVVQGQKLSEALLYACEVGVEGRATQVSLARDLHFNHKLAPSYLVVPIEATLTAALPTGNADPRAIRIHKPFTSDAITIQSFQDDVLVLSSLQRPRRLTVRGSDGRLYPLLCKPKDDLRKDQRLMEFNAMINRALRKDVESSKRRLYIKTNAVTPLNEECGTIEWVEGLKAMRDIILKLYKQKGVAIDYNNIRSLLNEACSDPSKLPIFREVILKKCYPVLYEWFIETFAEPDAWFAARLRFTRSSAVMSIVGHILGLGDRHGENVSLQEGHGGIFHVDFNCLFDKGLAFEKPELVPFRLTHNMVDAMGPQGYEGPYRTAAEITLSLLRSYTPQLMTILETFLHDPTTDFIGKRSKRATPGVPDTPQEILDSVQSKLGGLLRGESVPLSVEGYAEHLIREATSEHNLASMYIGWCAFF